MVSVETLVTFSKQNHLSCAAAVVKHFDDFHEDQFDFHAYCVRKVTLRAYVDVLRFEDNLWSESYYFRAAEGIIKIYLHLHDNPAIIEDGKEPDYSKMTAAERKKAKAIARKKRIQAEKRKTERLKKEAAAAENGGQKKKGGKPSPVDEDPDGEELMKKDPLDEAKKYSAILSKHSPKKIGTWALQYDVSIRRKKVLLALQSLFKMRGLDGEDPGYFSRLVDFGLKMPAFGDLPGVVRTVVQEEFSKLIDKKSISDFVSQAADRARQNVNSSLPARVAIAEGLVKIDPTSRGAAASIILDSGIDGKGVDFKSCQAALAALKSFGKEAEESTKQWLSIVKGRFPLITEYS